jgi:type IV pilus assembly protein PilC
VVGALVYPAVLVFLSLAMIVTMLVVVIPRFQGFYEGMNIPLPVLTRLLLGVSDLARGAGWIAFAALIVAIFLLRRFRHTEVGARLFDRLLLRIPLIGGILQRFSISEFSRSLATLLGGGFPLVPSLDVATTSVGNAFLRAQLLPVPTQVREGKSLHAALSKSGVIEELTIDMVKVGEATGALAEMLQSASDFLDEEIEVRLERLLSLLEPVMLMFMAVIVALLLLAMYMPMFSALGNIQ